jgi:hypothetical protein
LEEVKLTRESACYEYKGDSHIHSKYSDGSGTVRRIIKAARKAGLDYIIITDHNTMQAMEEGAEGWYDDLLVLVGEEIGAYGRRHYLAFGITEEIKPEDLQQDIRRYIEAVRLQGGIGFVPHPYGLDKPSFDVSVMPWDAWEDPGYAGLELWSYMCDLAENTTRLNIFRHYFDPDKAIHGPSLDLLKRWDQLCQTRRVVGISGSDVHAGRIFPFIYFLSYKRVFRSIRTHLLTPSPLSPDLTESKELVYCALKNGNCFFAHDALMDSTGFRFGAFTAEGRELLMGDEIRLESWAEIEVLSPVCASLRLFRNGHPVKELEADGLAWKATEPGVYRAEAQYCRRPWVFTNPIYLR